MEKHKIRDMRQYIEKILETVGEKRPVSLEVIGQTADKMSKEGHELYTTFSKDKYNIVIKIPVNPAICEKDITNFDGLDAIFRISHSQYKTPVNATLIMTPEQAWLAAKAGASYVSPFVGRIDDYIRQRAEIEFKKEDYFPAQDGLASPLLPSVHIHDAKLLDDNGKVITNVTNPSDTRTNMRLRLQIKPERWLKTYLKITPNLVRMEYNTGKLILTYETEKKTWEGKKTIFLLKGDNFDPVYFLAFFAPLENEKIVEELLNTKKNK